MHTTGTAGGYDSKLLEPIPHLLVIELGLLRLLQHLHRFRAGGIPFFSAVLLPVFPLLQLIIGAVILHLHRSTVGLAMALLPVSANLPAGTFRLIWSAENTSHSYGSGGSRCPQPIPGRIPYVGSPSDH